MEDEKKKKRNKKKKNRQGKTTTDDDVAVGADQNHLDNGQNDDVRSQASEPAEVQNVQVDVDRHQSNGTESAILADTEKQHLMQIETILEETVKQLRNERETHIQKEATLEEMVKKLQNESDLRKENVATLEETIKQLQNENDLYMQKEGTVEETIKQLRNENDSHIQKEGNLEMNIAKLKGEKDLWLQKEADLEEKISRLLDESAALDMKRASLVEKIKLLEVDRGSWTEMETISKETIASLNADITRLQMQVVELEDSRNNLLQENQQLKENVTILQSQLSSDEIKKRTSEQEDFKTHIEAAGSLIDKLIMENVGLVEKVNELSIKLDRQSVAVGLSSAIESDAMTTLASDTEPMTESSDNMSSLNHRLETREVVAVKEDRNGVDGVHAEPAASVINSSEGEYSGEIVQIPLDDNEVQDLELQVVESDKLSAVPLTDAPLIGAPFRLVSFVAKYVSGADLVNKNSSN